mmetsp:Transcript_16993/g.29247  ORF Transcript_16993/g.29247 Transcript_16993/m.29247 type:complete len:676 (-) Transcript_16993:629-2656(-)
MDDLLGGMNDWRNIQDVVRQTFKALHEVVRSQGDKIRALENRLKNSPSASEIENLQVSMSNKPTFGEMNKRINAALGEINIDNIRNQLRAKADKNELKDLYSDLTVATQRIGDGTSAIELLVRQQQAEIEALKREVKKLDSLRRHEDEMHVKFATKKWVEEVVDFESESRKQADSNQKKDLLELVLKLEEKLQDIPSVSTLDEVFAQKVDMNTLTRALQDRPTSGRMLKELNSKLTESNQLVLNQTNVAIRDATEMVLGTYKSEIERVESLLADKASRGEILELCGQKVSTSELEERLSATNQVLASEVKQAIIVIQKELIQVLNKKAFKADVHKMLQDKANTDDVQNWLSNKVELTDVRDALAQKADHDQVRLLVSRVDTMQAIGKKTKKKKKKTRRKSKGTEKDSLSKYLDASSIASSSDELSDSSSENSSGQENDTKKRLGKKYIAARLKRLEEEKAGIKDVCVLLDQKANVKDVNDALAQLSGSKLGVAESSPVPGHLQENVEEAILKLEKDVSHLTDAINSELSTGRWIWSSGRPLADRAVPWNIECINTSTENFLWRRDSPDITTVLPGLYEMSLGFFAEHDPEVQVLVNGEPTLYTSANNQNTTSRHTRKGGTPAIQTLGKVRRGKHSAGNVTGWTFIEFVALPARARITVLYDGDPGAQGFLSVRKL